MSELQGAVARVQLNKLDNILDNIRKNYIYFEKVINDFGLKIRKQTYKYDSGTQDITFVFIYLIILKMKL